ncbi:hypothetical protein [Rubrivirga sp.]|uniref:hypothetical protein n=1 Tax=Rubrivirga sp. TaxID=1885344 RepID=UPI003B52122B
MRFLVLASLLALAGCDRVPIDAVGTSRLVTSPDLSVVLVEPDLRLRIVPDGQGGPLALRVGGAEVPFDTTAAAFVVERTLVRGVNVLPLTVTDELGGVQTDTLYALYLPVRQDFFVDASDGVARADAAVARLDGDRALVSGGVGVSGEALASASILRLEPPRVLSTEVPLLHARAGHTATPVADGVLLLGGATGGTASDVVRAPEWVGPSGESREVEVVGGEDGPARVGHAARAVVLDGVTYLYLLGGRVPSGSGLSVSSTVDVFRVSDGGGLSFQLERLSPRGGASGFAGLADIAFAPTGPATAVAYGRADGPVALALRWSTPGTGAFPFSLGVRPGPALQTSRTGAAAVDIGGGLALVVGGRDADGAPVSTVEVVAAGVGRTFRLPPAFQLLVPRSDHVATIFGDGRIVIGGGRPAAGRAVVAYEALQL